MQSRFLFVAASLSLVFGFSACDSAPVEEVDPFQSRGRRTATASPPPTATPAPTARGSGPAASPASREGKHGMTPAPVSPAVKGGAPPAATPRNDEGGEVEERILIDPDSHRGRAKKLREQQKPVDQTGPPEADK